MKKAEERSKKQLLEQARDPRYMYRNDNQVDVAEIEDDLASLKEQLDRLKVRSDRTCPSRVHRLDCRAAVRPNLWFKESYRWPCQFQMQMRLQLFGEDTSCLHTWTPS